MDVLKTAITVFVILFPVPMKAQQNLQGKASLFITLKLKKPVDTRNIYGMLLCCEEIANKA